MLADLLIEHQRLGQKLCFQDLCQALTLLVENVVDGGKVVFDRQGRPFVNFFESAQTHFPHNDAPIFAEV